MLNSTTIMGRLTKTPELRYTKTGVPVVSFSVACQRDYAGSEGGQPKTDFFGCDAWRGTAEFIAKYFDTGDMIVVSGRLQNDDMIVVSGRLQNDEWTDNDGNRRVTTKITAEHVYFGESRRSKQVADISAADFEELDDKDGELPF